MRTRMLFSSRFSGSASVTHAHQQMFRVVVLHTICSTLSGVVAFQASRQPLSIRPSPPAKWHQKQAPTPLKASITTDTSMLSEDSEEEHHGSAVILEGKSPKVIRLRKAIQDICEDKESTVPIVLLGPKGSGKPSIVEEILEKLSSPTVHRLNLDDAVTFSDMFFGSNDTNGGVLDLWADQANATVVIKGFDSRTASNEEDFNTRQELEKTLASLLTKQTFYSRVQGKEIPFQPRLIYTMHGTKEPDYLKGSRAGRILWIRVPGLDSRTQDMAVIAQAKVDTFQKEYGLRNVQLTPEAIHRLLDHTWTRGEPELDQELRNALLRLALEQKKMPFLSEWPLPSRLESKHMMVQTPDESIRTRLLYQFPVLRSIINSPWIFDHFQRFIVAPIFIAILFVLFLGPQTRDHSAALTVFWAGWWPAVMLSFPLLGRIWCSICPFMIMGEFAREAVTGAGIELKKWPKWAETIGPQFAAGLFFLILMWEELWELPQNGALSAWLLLLITSGAVFNSVQFEKRVWCRHLCPIGAMCRTFGTMSMVEVRSFKANCQGCTNPQCVNGDSTVPDPSDTFALKGCTMGLKNNQLQDMGHCTLCMSCVKNCDKETPEVNLRPIGIDYGLPNILPSVFQDKKNLAISQVETNYWMGGLLTVLQGSVLLHYLPRIFYDLGIDPSIAKAGPGMDSEFFVHAAATVIVLMLPGLLSLFVDKIAVPLEDLWFQLQRSWGKPTIEDEMDRRMIVDVYESILLADKSLKETLEELDPDGDGRISCWEFKRTLQHLELPRSQCEAITGLMRQRSGQQWIGSMPIDGFLDLFQQLYMEARGNADSPRDKIQLETTKTFVELFDDLDRDGDGFILPGDFDALIDRDFRIKRTWEEKLELFRSADVVGKGRLNLFEFMALMRKIAKAGIQEIGYGYLPLAWGSLTAYWVGLGLKELGLTLARLPDTFYLDRFFSLQDFSWVAGDGTVELVQTVLVLGALPISIGLTQKLCDDNKITGLRFGVHAAVQVVGAWTTLYLMLSPNPLMA